MKNQAILFVALISLAGVNRLDAQIFAKHLECYRDLIGHSQGYNIELAYNGPVLVFGSRGAANGFFLVKEDGALFQPLPRPYSPQVKTDYYFKLPVGDEVMRNLNITYLAVYPNEPEVGGTSDPIEGAVYLPVDGEFTPDLEAKKALTVNAV